MESPAVPCSCQHQVTVARWMAIGAARTVATIALLRFYTSGRPDDAELRDARTSSPRVKVPFCTVMGPDVRFRVFHPFTFINVSVMLARLTWRRSLGQVQCFLGRLDFAEIAASRQAAFPRKLHRTSPSPTPAYTTIAIKLISVS